jgi:signal peptidase I
MSINLESFFKPVNNDVITNPNPRIAKNLTPKKGDVITFNYTMWKNDPYPLIIITSYYPGVRITGVNLHYLTFNTIKKLLKNCNNPLFNYNIIKDDKYIVGGKDSKTGRSYKGAFRSYKFSGVRQVKILDCSVLLKIMSMVRSTDAADMQIIRKQVQDQIRKQINPRAEELTDQETTIKQTSPSTNAAPDVKTIPTAPVVGQG